MQGVVTDARTGKALFPVTVVNTKTHIVSSTDERGFYTITAQTGEMVAFTYIGYKAVEKVKPLSVIIATQNITMEPTEYRLQEFKVRPGHLTKYQVDSIERAQTYKLPLQRTAPSAFMSPASALAELFSKKAKRTYEFQKVFAAGEKEKFVDSRYTADLVTRITHLEGDSVGLFMNTHPMPYNYARLASELELNMWIRNSYKEWLLLPAVDTLK